MSTSTGKPQDRILLPLAALREGAVHLEGELPASVVDLDDDSGVVLKSGIRYLLDAQLLGSEILVQGSAELDLELECARSGAFFSTTVGDSSFLRAYLISDVPESLDLTEEVRDAVVIEIPPFPKSPEAESEDFVLPGLSQEGQVGDAGAESAWSALDDLDIS
jgi:uncharacterized metal-binding protein YceD (DUF177 family)